MKTETKRKLISVVFPERCPYCKDVVKPLETACEDCKKTVEKDIYKKLIRGDYRVLSAVQYDGICKDAILKLKFGKKKQYAYQLAKLMAEKLQAELEAVSFDVITFVPLHKDTLKERGFNQSGLLAKYLSELLGIPCEALLKKTKKNKPQHECLGKKREENVTGVFKCIAKANIEGRKILLVDDIVTTGFTLAECAQTLKEKGAEDIFCVTFALTLQKNSLKTD